MGGPIMSCAEDYNNGKCIRYTENEDTEIPFFPERIIINCFSCSAVIIYCAEDLRDTIAERFEIVFKECCKTILEENWIEDDDIEDAYDEFLDLLLEISKTKDGVLFLFDSFDVHLWSDYSVAAADDQLRDALKIITEEYPTVRYEGHIAYFQSDGQGYIEIRQYLFSSDKTPENFPFFCTGAALESVLRNDDIWDCLLNNYTLIDEFIELLELFKIYSDWLPSDTLNRLLSASFECEKKYGKDMNEFRLLLLEYKNAIFPNLDPLDEFTLE